MIIARDWFGRAQNEGWALRLRSGRNFLSSNERDLK